MPCATLCGGIRIHGLRVGTQPVPDVDCPVPTRAAHRTHVDVGDAAGVDRRAAAWARCRRPSRCRGRRRARGRNRPRRGSATKAAPSASVRSLTPTRVDDVLGGRVGHRGGPDVLEGDDSVTRACPMRASRRAAWARPGRVRRVTVRTSPPGNASPTVVPPQRARSRSATTHPRRWRGPGEPLLSSSTSAAARRASSSACAAIPLTRVVFGMPRCSTRRWTRVSVSVRTADEVVLPVIPASTRGACRARRSRRRVPQRRVRRSAPRSRVGDGFQIAQSSPVPEDDSPQSGSVQNPVVRDHAGTESFADRGEGRHTGLDDFSGDPVGVDDDSAQTGQPCRDTGLPHPIPPVNPTRSMAARYRCHRDTRARSFAESRPRVVPVTEPYAGCSPRSRLTSGRWPRPRQPAARHYLIDAFRTPMAVDHKGGPHDLVTEHDASGRSCARTSPRFVPDSAFVGEEGGRSGQRDRSPGSSTRSTGRLTSATDWPTGACRSPLPWTTWWSPG